MDKRLQMSFPHYVEISLEFLNIDETKLDDYIAEDTKALHEIEDFENKAKAYKWLRSARLGVCLELKFKKTERGGWDDYIENNVPLSKGHIDRLRYVGRKRPEMVEEDLPKFIEMGITKTYQTLVAKSTQAPNVVNPLKEELKKASVDDLPLKPKEPEWTERKLLDLLGEASEEVEKAPVVSESVIDLVSQIYEMCETKLDKVVSVQ